VKNKKLITGLVVTNIASAVCCAALAAHYHVPSKIMANVRAKMEPRAASGFSRVEITSSFDGAAQNAYFYAATGSEKAPLVVSLHPWSSDWTYIENPSSLARKAREADWNFIYPDFRGTNDTPQAVLSEAALADIDDAIEWAMSRGNVDESRIVVVGLSGGGMAALGVYARSRHPLRYCMAWCPISDLEAWYYQSQNAGTTFWRDIAAATGSGEALDAGAARARSPYWMIRGGDNKELLEIFAGINDGYTGTVSTLHSLLFYNRAAEMLGMPEEVIADREIIRLVSRTVDPAAAIKYIADRKVLYERASPGLGLCIFDGTHEMLFDYAFDRIREVCGE
jgi:pimeloyl-ACP methyl ester carboxylesterase